MKYIFETSTNGNKYQIKITVQDNKLNTSNSNSYTIFAIGDQSNDFGIGNNIESLLPKIVNNIRLTVSERTEAEGDIKKFLNYLSLKEADVADKEIPIFESI